MNYCERRKKRFKCVANSRLRQETCDFSEFANGRIFCVHNEGQGCLSERAQAQAAKTAESERD